MNVVHETTPENLLLVTDTARACAQGWVEQAREDSARTWTGLIPDADVDFVERERLGRPMTCAESAEFSRTFRDEYAACMEQRAAREGWDE